MKVLLDTCIWGGAKDTLIRAGHDVVWTGDFDEDPGDEQILNDALREGRVLVTLDKDFGELAIVRGLKHTGIVRLAGFPAREQGPVCARILETYSRDLQLGAIVTVDPGRVRIRSESEPEEPRAE